MLRAFAKHDEIEATLVHTGQHYDANLSDVFFEELEMKRPDISLEVGSGKHGEQTARILERAEQTLEENSFNRVIVVGDVNSTMAVTLAAVKLHVPVAHVEAGLRSFDRSMPEEINRIVTDSVCDMLLVSEPSGIENLRREGHPEERLHLVGNVMIDTLKSLLPKARKRDTLKENGLEGGKYGVVTLHRPANVDTPEVLSALLDVLIETSRDLPLVFPVHPRTQARLDSFGLATKLREAPGVLQLPPAGYLDFLCMTSQARVIVTDSGGLQEESTVLGIPCLTARPNTERPVTVTEGTSTLIDSDADQLRVRLEEVLNGSYKQGKCPELWDGRAAERIAETLVRTSG
jgi:UDP-N-acetylglucosamine 2-epimerase (non-hydrolysing)